MLKLIGQGLLLTAVYHSWKENYKIAYLLLQIAYLILVVTK